MKIVFHEDFHDHTYASDSASAKGRMKAIMDVLSGISNYEIIKPQCAGREDVLRAHSEAYVANLEKDVKLFYMAFLSAGGAVTASEQAYIGNPSFACIRPPGHHASRTSAWGHCYLNNMGIAILKLIHDGKIKNAFILDFDLHTGDGNINVLADCAEVDVFNPYEGSREGFLKAVESRTKAIEKTDIIAVSAGFDGYEYDLGGRFKTSDYYFIGCFLKACAKRLCFGRRFALLEGGYYQPDLGKNVLAFCEGFK